MTTFTAGRFIAECYIGPQNGEATRIVQTHANGSVEIVGSLDIPKGELQDLEYVLRRALAAHNVRP